MAQHQRNSFDASIVRPRWHPNVQRTLWTPKWWRFEKLVTDEIEPLDLPDTSAFLEWFARLLPTVIIPNMNAWIEDYWSTVRVTTSAKPQCYAPGVSARDLATYISLYPMRDYFWRIVCGLVAEWILAESQMVMKAVPVFVSDMTALDGSPKGKTWTTVRPSNPNILSDDRQQLWGIVVEDVEQNTYYIPLLTAMDWRGPRRTWAGWTATKDFHNNYQEHG